MSNLLADQGEAVNFLVLLIVKLDERARLHIGARTYLASGHKLSCEIEIEGVATKTAFDGRSNDEESE